MPYELRFTRQVEVHDPEVYWNDCCIGGDIVLNQLLPHLREAYDGLETNQEDWGWFAWFEKSKMKLAVDVFADDAEAGQFRIHLTSRIPRFLLGDKIEDTPELEELRALVTADLEGWSVLKLQIVRLNSKYMEVSGAT